MGKTTGIEWTDATWNPIIGCSRVSEGCRNCYAEGIAGRFGGGKPTVYSGLTQIVNGRAVWTGQIAETKQLLAPLSWKAGRKVYDADGKCVGRQGRQRIFVNSMSDLFHENVTDEQRDKIFAVMALCPQHDFQVLTKRPKLMLDYMKQGYGRVADVAVKMRREGGDHSPVVPLSHVKPGASWWPLPNVWLGVSVENQATADARIPLLLQTQAAVRFISAEPLLGAVEIWRWLTVTRQRDRMLDWVICGGESGPGARPMHPDWTRSLRDQCQAARVPFFFKQWGEFAPFTTLPSTSKVKGHTWDNGATFTSVARFGKHAAGAKIDGIEYKEFPKEMHVESRATA